jgi:hypothetical protein
VCFVAQPHADPEPTAASTRITVQGAALRQVREARAWLSRLAELGVALQLVIAGVALMWFVRQVIDVRSTAVLLVVLLLPAATYLVLRRPETVAGRDLLAPVRAFGRWLASLSEIGRVIELGLLALVLMWFTSAVVGVDSVPLYALELVAPQVVYLILSAREKPRD